jgi:hypothetical protein
MRPDGRNGSRPSNSQHAAFEMARRHALRHRRQLSAAGASYGARALVMLSTGPKRFPSTGRMCGLRVRAAKVASSNRF